MLHSGTEITVIYRLYQPPRRSWITGYRYDHSDDANLTVGNLEHLEPPGILGHHRPRVFCMRSGINQSYLLEHDWERLSKSSTWKVKGRTPESK